MHARPTDVPAAKAVELFYFSDVNHPIYLLNIVEDGFFFVNVHAP